MNNLHILDKNLTHKCFVKQYINECQEQLANHLESRRQSSKMIGHKKKDRKEKIQKFGNINQRNTPKSVKKLKEFVNESKNENETILKKMNNNLLYQNQNQKAQISAQQNKIKELEILVAGFQEQIKLYPSSNPYMIKKMNTNNAISIKLKEKFNEMRRELNRNEQVISDLEKELKYTSMKELRIERELLRDECMRLKNIIKQKNYFSESIINKISSNNTLNLRLENSEKDRENLIEELKKMQKAYKNEKELRIQESKEQLKEISKLNQEKLFFLNQIEDLKGLNAQKEENSKLCFKEKLDKFEEDHKLNFILTFSSKQELINKRINNLICKAKILMDFYYNLKKALKSEREVNKTLNKRNQELEKQIQEQKILEDARNSIIANLKDQKFPWEDLKKVLKTILVESMSKDDVNSFLTQKPFEITNKEHLEAMNQFFFFFAFKNKQKEKNSSNQGENTIQNQNISRKEFKIKFLSFINYYKIEIKKSDWLIQLKKIRKNINMQINNAKRKEIISRNDNGNDKGQDININETDYRNQYHKFLKFILDIYDFQTLSHTLLTYCLIDIYGIYLSIENFSKFLIDFKVPLINNVKAIEYIMLKLDPNHKGNIRYNHLIQIITEFKENQFVCSLNSSIISDLIKLSKYLSSGNKEIALVSKMNKNLFINLNFTKKILACFLVDKLCLYLKKKLNLNLTINNLYQIQRGLSALKIDSNLIEIDVLFKVLDIIAKERSEGKFNDILAQGGSEIHSLDNSINEELNNPNNQKLENLISNNLASSNSINLRNNNSKEINYNQCDKIESNFINNAKITEQVDDANGRNNLIKDNNQDNKNMDNNQPRSEEIRIRKTNYNYNSKLKFYSDKKVHNSNINLKYKQSLTEDFKNRINEPNLNNIHEQNEQLMQNVPQDLFCNEIGSNQINKGSNINIKEFSQIINSQLTLIQGDQSLKKITNATPSLFENPNQMASKDSNSNKKELESKNNKIISNKMIKGKEEDINYGLLIKPQELDNDENIEEPEEKLINKDKNKNYQKLEDNNHSINTKNVDDNNVIKDFEIEEKSNIEISKKNKRNSNEFNQLSQSPPLKAEENLNLVPEKKEDEFNLIIHSPHKTINHDLQIDENIEEKIIEATPEKSATSLKNKLNKEFNSIHNNQNHIQSKLESQIQELKSQNEENENFNNLKFTIQKKSSNNNTTKK